MSEDPGQFGFVMTTTATKEDAARIAKSLLHDRLAACVQVLPIESYYTWRGETANDAEWLLLIKTRTALFDRAIASIKAAHPYKLPEIVATAFAAGYTDYLDWIASVTGDGH